MLNKYYKTTWNYVQGRQSIRPKATKLRKFLGKNENSDLSSDAEKFTYLTVDKTPALGVDFWNYRLTIPLERNWGHLAGFLCFWAHGQPSSSLKSRKVVYVRYKWVVMITWFGSKIINFLCNKIYCNKDL